MILVDAVYISARYNGALFAKHTQEESRKARMTILSAFSNKYQKLVGNLLSLAD